MTWQQWVLLFWMLLRVPFMINREVKKPRIDENKEMKSGDRERAVVIGVLAVLFVQAILIALVVTI